MVLGSDFFKILLVIGHGLQEGVFAWVFPLVKRKPLN